MKAPRKRFGQDEKKAIKEQYIDWSGAASCVVWLAKHYQTTPEIIKDMCTS